VRHLLAEWPDGEPEPVTDWLASLPVEVGLQRLVWLAKLRWRGEEARGWPSIGPSADRRPDPYHSLGECCSA
jgi:hypothetical protein